MGKSVKATTFKLHGPEEEFQMVIEFSNGDHVLKVLPAWKWNHPKFTGVPFGFQT